MYEDTGGNLFAALIILAVTIFLFLLCGRFIGWLLGISTISKNQEIIIEQNNTLIAENNDLIELLEKSLQLQRAVAKKQFGHLESYEDWDEE